MKGKRLIIGFYLALLLALSAGGLYGAEEMYIITTSSGAQIVVRDYHFRGDNVTYTTQNGERGSMRKSDFLSIANMIGVPPVQEGQARSPEQQKKRDILIWLGAAGVIGILYVCYLLLVTRRKNREGRNRADIYYGRIEKDPVTPGHLAFIYRGPLWRKTNWTIEVRRAYEEDSILFVEGICTTTGRRKTFRADRVVGKVLDKSSERQAPMARFFVDAESR